jgi:hypothetical protein
MCVTGGTHVCEWLQFPGGLIDAVDSVEVGLSVGYTAPSDINLASHLDRLAVPDVGDLLISEHTLFFRPGLHIKENNVVVVEEMQANFP